MEILTVTDLYAGYKDVPVLQGVSLALEEGTTTCLVGGNGNGKTTFLRAVMGQIPATHGAVIYDGEDVTSLPAHRKVGMGLVMVPEGRQLFAALTVKENIELGATPARAHFEREDRRAWVFELFPRLKERLGQRAGTLSGGEQQMVAVARALMAAPRVLMLDEPSLGLAPVMVLRLFEIIKRLRETGITMLLVEQNVPMAMSVSDHAYVLSQGQITLSGPARDLLAMPEVRHAYLGLAAEPGTPGLAPTV